MTTIYHWKQIGDKLPKYERRVTICSAVDEKSAKKALLREAKNYSDSNHTVFLDHYYIEEIDEEPSIHPIEITHELTIGVDLKSGTIIEPDKFLEQHWHVSKIDSCHTFGFKHAWYNIDHTTSGCYNCKQVTKGQLWQQEPDA
jgi:hypothetical protein